MEMMEDAVGKYVEGVRRRGVGKDQPGGMDLLDERTVLKFKIREDRSAREAKA